MVCEGFARYHSAYARLLGMELLSNEGLGHLKIPYYASVLVMGRSIDGMLDHDQTISTAKPWPVQQDVY